MAPPRAEQFSPPNNRDFYRKFRYPVLTREPCEIRLVQINAFGRGKHALISNVSFESAPRYRALSYCAGDPKKTRTINIDGHDFNAYASLAISIDHAFDMITKKGSSNQVLYLWMDQICINQNDNEERTRQVNLMRDIYSNVEVVIISLPLYYDLEQPQHGILEHCSEILALETLKDWPSEQFDFTPSKTYRPGAAEVYFVGNRKKAWVAISAIVRSPWWQRAWVFQEFMMADRAYFLIHNGDSRSPPVYVPWMDLAKLADVVKQYGQIHKQSCERLLTRLETLDAENIQLLDETSQVYADKELLQTREFLHSMESAKLKNLHKVPITVTQLETKLRGIASEMVHAVQQQEYEDYCSKYGTEEVNARCDYVGIFKGRQISRFRTLVAAQFVSLVEERRKWFEDKESEFESLQIPRRQLLDHYLLAIMSIKKHLEVVKAAQKSHKAFLFIISSKQTSRFPMDLSILMDHASNCQSSDSRDRVYAFLGLTDPRCGIVPRYDVSLNTVRTQLTKAIVLMEQSLNVLILARKNSIVTAAQDPLPSWVPEWFSLQENRSEYLTFRREAGFDGHKFSASGASKHSVSFEKDRHGNIDRVLEASCLYVDTLNTKVHDDYSMHRTFEGQKYGSSLSIKTQSNGRARDEVWIILGLDEPYLLRRYGNEATIIGPVMLLEKFGDCEKPSQIMYGSLYAQYLKQQKIRCEIIRIT